MLCRDFVRPVLRLVAVQRATVVLASPVMAQSDVAERLAFRVRSPSPITEYVARLVVGSPSGGYYKQEYVPAGQAVESYTAMFLIEAVTSGATPEAAAKAMTDGLDQRKGVDPVVNYDMIQE